MKAAVFHGPHKPLTIEDVDIDKPIGREVLVRTVASGVCHSDLHFIEGLYPFAAPAILGHEAAGIVEAVGPHVDEFKPGDHVIACLSVFCGHCEYCLTGRTHLCQSRPVRSTNEPPKLTWNGAPVNQFANLSSYAEQMLVHDSGLVKVRDDMPLDRARADRLRRHDRRRRRPQHRAGGARHHGRGLRRRRRRAGGDPGRASSRAPA